MSPLLLLHEFLALYFMTINYFGRTALKSQVKACAIVIKVAKHQCFSKFTMLAECHLVPLFKVGIILLEKDG